jgi:glucose-1-phosphate thymidylyltransferase
MKGLMLAGGRGTPLRPITHTSAKQLVPVANKPILFYGIEHMVEVGITDIAVVVGETAAEVRGAVGDGSRWGATITYLDQPEPLGLAHCVQLARDFLGDDDFIMYLGDNLLQHGLRDLVEGHAAAAAGRGVTHTPTLEGGQEAPSAFLLLCPVPDPQRFGIAEIDGSGRIVRLVEKPADPPSDLAMVGVYLFTPAIHHAVAAIEPSSRGELEIADAVQWLIDRGDGVRHEQLSGWWLDTGKKDSLLEANRRVLDDLVPRCEGDVDSSSDVDGRVVVEAGARLMNTTVRGPAIIGAGARLVDAYVGPFTSVGAEVQMQGSQVENSVLLDRVHLRGDLRLVDSLVGRDTEVTRSTRPARAARVMLGDDCSVELG